MLRNLSQLKKKMNLSEVVLRSSLSKTLYLKRLLQIKKISSSNNRQNSHNKKNRTCSKLPLVYQRAVVDSMKKIIAWQLMIRKSMRTTMSFNLMMMMEMREKKRKFWMRVVPLMRKSKT